MEVGNSLVLNFRQNVPSRNILARSEDGRLSLCTNSGVYILEFQCQPFSTSPKSKLNVRFLSLEQPRLQFNAGISRDLVKENVTQYFSKEDALKFGLDVSLRQSLWVEDSTDYHFKVAKWSPLGLVDKKRCLLAVLTSDHRLCIYKETLPAKQWDKVADVSEMFNVHKLNDWPEINKKTVSVQELQDRIHSLAAIDLSWSPIWSSGNIQRKSPKEGNHDNCFSLLAVLLQSGQMALWKVPADTKSSEIELVSVSDVCTGQPECVEWYPNTIGSIGLVGVGSVMGEIMVIEVCVSDQIQVVRTLSLWESLDQMTVSCLHWINQDNAIQLLATKELFIMGFELWKEGDNYVVNSKTHTRGQHLLPATGICSRPGKDHSVVLLSSCDGLLQRVHVSQTKNQIQISTEVIPHNPDVNYRWQIHGVQLSRNSVFALIMESPSSKVHYRVLKNPEKVHVLPMVDVDKEYENLLVKVLSADDSFDAVWDYMEILRQYLCRGKSFPEFFTEMWETRDKWYYLSVRQLQILRYFTTTKLSLAITSSYERDEKLAKLLQADVKKLTELIITHHSVGILKFLARETIQLRQYELISLKGLCEAVKVTCSDQLKPFHDLSVKINHKFSLDNQSMEYCVICGEEFQRAEFLSVKCSNGHQFGCCCISLLSCQSMVYRKCQICGALALPQEQLQDFPWLSARNLSLCVLCGGYLT